MTPSIQTCNLFDQVNLLIADSQVRAAFFSTFTFDRNFFEKEVLVDFLAPKSCGYGRFPVTVFMDRRHYTGHARGYDVRLFDTRLWHAKTIVLMTGTQRDPRTIFLCGSGNLTRCGWQSNLELFLAVDWPGWSIPSAVATWFRPDTLGKGHHSFVSWLKRYHIGRCPPRINRLFLTSAREAIWDQWPWWGAWTHAHIVSPFIDAGIEDGQPDPDQRKFFETLASTGAGKLNLYLPPVKDDPMAVIGPWKVIKWLDEQFDLRVFRVRTERPLHGKLFAVRAQGSWWILGGSPNASGAAMTQQGGNVELAWQYRSRNRNLPSGLLPVATKLKAIQKQYFRSPEYKTQRKTWNAVECAIYDPRSKRIDIHWASKKFSFGNTELKWDKTRITGHDIATPGEDRTIETQPLGRKFRREFAPGFAPIEWPLNECDSLGLDGEKTVDDYLALLSGESEIVEGGPGPEAGSPNAPRPQILAGSFEWRQRVSRVYRCLKVLREGLLENSNDLDCAYYLRIVRGLFAAAERQATGSGMAKAFHEWVKSEIYGMVQSLDRRIVACKKLRRFARGWKSQIDTRLI